MEVPKIQGIGIAEEFRHKTSFAPKQKNPVFVGVCYVKHIFQQNEL